MTLKSICHVDFPKALPAMLSHKLANSFKGIILPPNPIICFMIISIFHQSLFKDQISNFCSSNFCSRIKLFLFCLKCASSIFSRLIYDQISKEEVLKMAEVGISIAAKVAEYTVDPLVTQLGYIWKYKSNFKNLEKQVQKLEGTHAMVQHSVEEATRNGEEIERKVVNWLDNVKEINEEATKIIENNNRANVRCFKSLCPDLKKRYQHSKNAANKADDVSELEKQGKFHKVSYRTTPEEPWDMFLNNYKDFESRRSIVENVLTTLNNPDIDMVGIYGMGGIGKTTLARVVGKQAEKDKLFDVVVFVDVSEIPDVKNIQGAIADKLGLKFHEETESGRARKLCEQLQKGRKILIILDNIWRGLDFNKVGIPFGGDHRVCKLLLTARSIDVLSTEMNSPTNFCVGNLNEKDAWDLFEKVAGACIEQYGLQPIASEVAKRCGGLPIAIVTIAKALKDKQVHAWRSVLRELKRPSSENLVGSVTTDAYSCIQLSYNHLETDELKSTFLLCSTMGFTSDASIEKLLRYGMGLNLFKTVYTMEEARDKVNTLVQELKNSSLLLETSDDERFSIHDVVRDVGRAIASNDHNNFTVNDDFILRDLVEKNRLKKCTSISLLDVAKLPEKLDCPHLTFFYVKTKTRFPKIPSNFFKGMPNLEVLHMIEVDLSPLSASLRYLKNLRTLYMCHCHLGDLSGIKYMNKLEILVLSSDIKQLPKEIGRLTQLRVLDLNKCYDVEVIPPSTISRLTKLEELYMPYYYDQWEVEGTASLNELKNLSRLTALQIRIQDAKIVPKDLFFQKLERYKIYIGVVDRWRYFSWHKTSKLLALKTDASSCVDDGVVKQLKGIEDLYLIGKQGVQNVVHKLNRDGFPKLKHFDVESNTDLVYIVNFSKQMEPCVAFPHLETLSLRHLMSLEKICHGQLTPNSFCRLRIIKVESCVTLTNIFSSTIARNLLQLQEIAVDYCGNMEEIFTIGRINEVIVLGKLQSLSLKDLPKLRSFCSEAEEASKSDPERQIVDTLMPLFDGKVEFPNLKTLELHAINFEKMWHIQLPLKSCCFQNLADLIISSCCNLKYLFSSSTLTSFVHLQYLVIRYCTVLEEIIRIDDSRNDVTLPLLTKLSIENCPEMKAFIFSNKVTFPSIEEIEISDMDNLEMIWQNQIEDSLNLQYCPKLSKMRVTNCQSLKNLFPALIARNLRQLKDLHVDNCSIEEIVAKEEGAEGTFVFPQLTSLGLQQLPMLKKLNVVGCDKIHPFFTSESFNLQENISESQPDILQQETLESFSFQENISETQPDILQQEKVFPNLEELRLDGSKTRLIWQRQFPKILFPKLKILEIQNDESTVLPSKILNGCTNLERLSLQDSSYEWIFSCEEVEKHVQIKSLCIYILHNLEEIWKQNSKEGIILKNLEKLEVSFCSSLVTLIPPSASFRNLTILSVWGCIRLANLVSSSVAKSLVQLKVIKIRDCDMMTEVIADEGDEEEIINFNNLKSLELVFLSSLTSFCSGNHNFNFPSLEKFTVERCDKMKIFSSRVVSTPMLREIKIDREIFCCVNDVSTTMQKIHEKEVENEDEDIEIRVY